jgi:hypothetical protein
MNMLNEIIQSTWPACTEPSPTDPNKKPFIADAVRIVCTKQFNTTVCVVLVMTGRCYACMLVSSVLFV